MFPEPIEAWDYGPVIYDVWHAYRDFEGRKDILEPLTGKASSLNEVEITCVGSALAQYGEQSGARLIDITHLGLTPGLIGRTVV